MRLIIPYYSSTGTPLSAGVMHVRDNKEPLSELVAQCREAYDAYRIQCVAGNSRPNPSITTPLTPLQFAIGEYRWWRDALRSAGEDIGPMPLPIDRHHVAELALNVRAWNYLIHWVADRAPERGPTGTAA